MSFISVGFVFFLVLCQDIGSVSGQVVLIPPEQGAVEAVPHSHPWLIAMFQTLYGQTCSLTVIKICESCNQSDILVTAAHCVAKYEGGRARYLKTLFVKLVGGMHNISNWEQEPSPRHLQGTGPRKMVAHPEWAKGDMFQDIAVVKTDRPYQLNEYVAAIELPSQNHDLSVGSQCKIAGWGKAGEADVQWDHLQEINVTVVEDEACLKTFGADDYNGKWMTCGVSSQKGGGTACEGDSGAPVVCRNDKHTPIMQALVVGGDEKCWKHYQTIYTSLGPYVDWIYKTAFELTRVKKDEFLCKAAGMPCDKQ